MTAYIIFIRKSVSDSGEMEIYSRLASSADRGFEVKNLVRYGELEVLEGPPIEGIYMSEFPTMQEAREWYRSSAYTDARQHRLRGADYDVYLFEGLSRN